MKGKEECVVVLGAGSWGTALAKLFADRGIPTWLWARRSEQAEAIESERENAAYLPGVPLPETLRATSDLEKAVRRATVLLSVVPTHGLRDVWRRAAEYLPNGVPVVSATKGIENESLLLVTQILEQLLPPRHHDLLMALGGPSFAKEVARGVPTAVTLAGRDQEALRRVQHLMTTERFRAYVTEDLVGVELGGALKNVVAIAAGCADGLGLGHNARAALITRGLAEVSRLATKMGAHPLTLAGLAGMGDLVLTCTGSLSRNRSVGIELGRGRSLQEILAGMTMVAEGVRTARSARELAHREGVEMPITEEVYRVLYEGRAPLDALEELMRRPLRHERD